MNKGLQQNAFVKNGYEMLCIQAEENWKIWNTI
jgi:shikimate dehydrogenase